MKNKQYLLSYNNILFPQKSLREMIFNNFHTVYSPSGMNVNFSQGGPYMI